MKEKWKSGGKDRKMQRKEEKQNKDVRCEHCGLFTMSSQKKKSGSKVKVFQEWLSMHHSTQIVLQYKYRGRKGDLFRFAKLIS